MLLILASSTGYFFFAGVRTFAVLFISRRFGLPQAVTTLLVPLVGVGAIAGILTAGRISDRLIRRGWVDARIVVAAAGYLAAAALFLPALLTTSLAVGLPLGSGCGGGHRCPQCSSGCRATRRHAFEAVGAGRSRPHRTPHPARVSSPPALRLPLRGTRRRLVVDRCQRQSERIPCAPG